MTDQAKAGALRGFTVTLLFVSHAVTAEPPAARPLPSPFTLEQALTLADDPHPDLALSQSDVERARAHQTEVWSRTDLRAHLELTPEWVEPSTGGGWTNDSRARLLLSKQLYDFGRSGALERSAGAELGAREQQSMDARQQRRIEIMARFFDVLLADLRYAVDNENMAQLYVQFDRVRERHALKQVSEVDLLAAENRYRETLLTRTESQKRQVATRQRLALALNRPGELSAELVRPALVGNDRAIPDHAALFAEVLQTHPGLAAARADYEAARAAVEGERARRRPTLTGELEAAEYERAFASRNDRRATLNLRIPLYQGGEVDAAVGRAAAELQAREARLRKAEHDLRGQVLDLVQELETLKVRREAATQRLSYRDLYLDRARAVYELEVQTDLGDAMMRLAEAQWQAAKVEFELALAWAKIDALTGRLIPSVTETRTP